MSTSPSDPKRVNMFGFTMNGFTMDEAVARVFEWIGSPGPANRASHAPCHYVVTPNVDHAVLFQEHAGLRQAYEDAGMILADGFPVVVAARLLGRPLPGRVAGSDLVPALFSAATAARPLRVFLLGAAPGVADRAAIRIHSRWPHVTVVGTCSPPLGFEHRPDENAAIVERVAASRADLLVLGLGAPKQELWIHAHRRAVQVPVALCVGATIDFLAGEKKRAPRWMQVLGLEWCHRLLSEPRRLAKRYARDAWIFPQLVWREWKTA